MKRIIAALILLLILSCGALVFFRTSNHAPDPPPKPKSGDKYREAIDNINSARALLRAFVSENPAAGDAYSANLQLKALDNLIVTDIPIAPVPFFQDLTWRILTIDPQAAYTKVKIEIHNTNEQSQRGFSRFDQYPLSLMANSKFYAMKKESTVFPPSLIQDGSYLDLQGGQALTIDVYFDALDSGVTEGEIKYQIGNSQTPVKFSLLNTNQRPAEK